MRTPLALVACLLLAAPPSAQPRLDAPVYATIRPEPLVLSGSGFGAPGPEARLIVRLDGRQVAIASTSARILAWEDGRIVVATDAGARSAEVRVRTAGGQTPFVPAEVYAYDWFDIPPTAGTNALPLAIAVGADGQVWVNQEFHLDFQHLDPTTGVVTALSPPRPPGPGPFASQLFGDHRTQTSILGESVLVDPHGNVWFSQGGGYLYTGVHPNHSRIVRYDPDAPAAERWRVYNVPGDQNEVAGLAWDATRGRLWFTNGGFEAEAPVPSPSLVAFDPETTPWDNDFDFSTPLDHLVCPPGGPDDGCFRVYALPENSLAPSHMEVTADGLVWYTGYWGSRIGVLDPETDAVIEYPLHEQSGTFLFGPGPWEIMADANGDLVFTEFFDSAVGRFDASRRLDPACRRRNGAGRNPCIVERILPGADPEAYRLHTTAFAADGRLWFGQHVEDAEHPSHLGFFTPNGAHVVLLPPLQRFPGGGVPNVDGVAVDPTTGDVFFCEFLRKRIGRLRLVTDGESPDALAAASPAGEADGLAVSAFPSPARDRVTVTVTVALAEAGPVAVTVYDATGRRVAVLHEGAAEAGSLPLAFETSALPAGVYLVRAEGAGAAATARVVVAR
jgi:streptogramin lyase